MSKQQHVAQWQHLLGYQEARCWGSSGHAGAKFLVQCMQTLLTSGCVLMGEALRQHRWTGNWPHRGTARLRAQDGLRQPAITEHL